ncbi:MAG: DMT family transporter [Gemmataceae bacterium]
MSPSPAQARLCLVIAAVLWSSGSFFIRFLREPSGLATSLNFTLHEPGLTPLQVAFYRGLFGGLGMLVLVRRVNMRFEPRMIGMVSIFAAMSGLYMSALALGPAANAIFLQNTAPIWVYLFAVLVLKESADRRGWQSVLLGGIGAVVIVGGNWPTDLPPDEEQAQVAILLMGVGAGFTYAGVMIFLRMLRHHAPAWLTAMNLIGSAVALGAYVLLLFGWSEFLAWAGAPSIAQVAVLALYGVIQMAIPYWLFARSLRAVSPQEAGIITLIEPLLNPFWAYLMTPEKDKPTGPMLIGGGLILAALVWRYVPLKQNQPQRHSETQGIKRN